MLGTATGTRTRLQESIALARVSWSSSSAARPSARCAALMRSHRPMGSGKPSLVSSARGGATQRRQEVLIFVGFGWWYLKKPTATFSAQWTFLSGPFLFFIDSSLKLHANLGAKSSEAFSEDSLTFRSSQKDESFWNGEAQKKMEARRNMTATTGSESDNLTSM